MTNCVQLRNHPSLLNKLGELPRRRPSILGVLPAAAVLVMSVVMAPMSIELGRALGLSARSQEWKRVRWDRPK